MKNQVQGVLVPNLKYSLIEFISIPVNKSEPKMKQVYVEKGSAKNDQKPIMHEN